MTNADKLRSMNDRALANQLVIDIDGLQKCRLYLAAPIGKLFISRFAAMEATLQWLQRPSEGVPVSYGPNCATKLNFDEEQ